MSDEKKLNGKLVSVVFGSILIGVGLIFLVGNIFPSLSIGYLWPFFMLVPVGILIPVWLMDRKGNAGVLIPIVILTFYACYFLWLNFTTWENAEWTWPNFLIGPGLGFLAVFFANRQWGFTIPAFILLAMSAIFYAELIENTLILALVLMAIGLALIFKYFLSHKSEEVAENS